MLKYYSNKHMRCILVLKFFQRTNLDMPQLAACFYNSVPAYFAVKMGVGYKDIMKLVS